MYVFELKIACLLILLITNILVSPLQADLQTEWNPRCRDIGEAGEWDDRRSCVCQTQGHWQTNGCQGNLFFNGPPITCMSRAVCVYIHV